MVLRPVIFATGVPRCGSSWVGGVLSTAAGIRYNYEPFNPTRHPYLTRHHVYLAGADDDPALHRAARAACAGHIRFHQFLRGLRWGYAWRTIRPSRRLLLKDPTAMFLAEWMAEQFAAQVLVILRHPCAFASSVVRLGWPADVTEFLTQPRLMEDWLYPFEHLLKSVRKDDWARAGAFWGSVYTVLHGQMLRHPQWCLAAFEDLCLHPKREFSRLFDTLSLTGTRTTERILQDSTSTPSQHAKSTRRESRKMADIWKKRLSPAQIDSVMGVVREFRLPYYCDGDEPGARSITVANTAHASGDR